MLNLKPGEIEEYLKSKGVRFRRRGNKAELEVCAWCGNGDNNDRWKCVVYLDESGGNYRCMRGSCDATGTFWGLVEQLGDDPKQFYTRDKVQHSPAAPRLKAEITFKSEPVDPQKLTPQAIAYLKSRGFTHETIENISIWCDEKGMINFGYYHEGELCMVKVRRPGATPKGDQKAWQAWKGGLRTLWGLEQCDAATPYIVITFGEYDRIALRQARVMNAVSVPCGDKDLEWINVCYDDLAKFDEIVLWPDNDKSCQEMVERIAERLGKSRVRVVKCEYKDPNDMLVTRGKEEDFETAEQEMFALICEAPWFFAGDLKQVADIGDAEQTFDGYLSGIGELDKCLGGFFNGQVTLHAGSTKSGKSAAVNQIAAMAADAGGTVCIWPGEDTAADFKYKLSVHLAGFVGVEMRHSQRTGTEYAWVLPEYKHRIDDWLRDKIIMIDKRAGMDEDELLDNFTLAFKRYGADTFIIDNLAKLVLAKDTGDTNGRQARIMNKISDFAKEFRVHVHLVVHTNKSGFETEPPTRNSISGTKDLINLADRVIIWWRIPESVKSDYGHNETLVSVAADRIFGAEPSIPVRYHVGTKRYGMGGAELSREYSI